MSFYHHLIRPILFSFNPETAHHITFSLLKIFDPFISLFSNNIKNETLSRELLGLKFPNPIGLAAGLDKDGKAFGSMAKLGFGFIELGTVTPKPQPGNPKPRLFRIKRDNALINRMGFNNLGVDELASKLENRTTNIVIGGNIGKNTSTPNSDAKSDYLYCFKRLLGLVDYFVVNVSCPNIKDLKKLQDKDSLLEILKGLTDHRRESDSKVPILLKVSPDLNITQLEDLIEIVNESGIDGLIATNTSTSRDQLTLPKPEIDRIGNGGLSGAPIHQRSLEVIKYLRANLPADFPIIASGGIMSGKDAINAMNAGAQLVQLYTGFIYNGPGLIKKILRSLA